MWITRFDERVTRYWLNHRFSGKIDTLFRFYTRMGDGYIWALVIAYVLIRYGGVFFSKIVIQVLISLLVCLTLYWVIKLCVRRRRPFDVIDEVKSLIPPLDKYSFPSGHTMNNLAIAATVCAFAPEVGWIMVFLPLTWGLLRVYFGVHCLSDVVGGFFLGILSFAIANRLWLFFGSTIVNFLLSFQCHLQVFQK